MKIYGRTTEHAEALNEMREVSIVASPDDLRSIADFLIAQADAMLKEDHFDHVHYSDYVRAEQEQVEIVVCNPSVLGTG